MQALLKGSRWKMAKLWLSFRANIALWLRVKGCLFYSTDKKLNLLTDNSAASGFVELNEEESGRQAEPKVQHVCQ